MNQITQDNLLATRRAGILLHPTSLPGSPGNGDIGQDAYRFVDFLSACGFSVWQMLPTGPTHPDHSPYQCLSVHAGNPLLISLDWLRGHGLLSNTQCRPDKSSSSTYRIQCLQQAYQYFRENKGDINPEEYESFIEKHANWLDEYAMFRAIRKQLNGKHWLEWPDELRDHDEDALKALGKDRVDDINEIKFEQFIFFQQWHELKQYANQQGIQLFGDMPIFVAHDSAEVWAHREYFAIDEHGHPEMVAGVPPDYFSETGQRWGNPHYNWDRMQEDGFAWWIHRMQTQLDLFDLVRIDHFRGLEAYWEIPAESDTAMEGNWVKAPGHELLSVLYNAFHKLPVVAEDLGTITREVDELRNEFGIPGMKIMQFAFDGSPDNPYLPHNHEPNCVVYTGTHDNSTAVGWYESLPEESQNKITDYLGQADEPMPWPLIRCALESVAELAILPMQDILELGEEHRMNTPGTTEGNWQWRFEWEQVPAHLTQKLHHLINMYGRTVTSD